MSLSRSPPTSTGQAPELTQAAAASRSSAGGSISDTKRAAAHAEDRVRRGEGEALSDFAVPLAHGAKV